MKRYHLIVTPVIILLWLLGLLAGKAQSVTYNADERKAIKPHEAAAVELYSKGKGVLLPKVDCNTRTHMTLTADAIGLVIYQTDSVKGLYEWDGLEWRCLNPMEITDDSGAVRQLHRIALSGKYLDLQDRPNIPQSINDLSEVAFSGSYNDLDDRPRIPDMPPAASGDGQSFAQVALTGDYLDLLNRPHIPQSIHDLSDAAFSGSYADLETKLPIPTSLSELEPDDEHQTIEDDDAAWWDELAAMSVPTKLAQLESDYNNNLVTEKEIQTWNAIEHRDIPRRASEFYQDEFYRTVTASDKARWNAAAETPYPTMLRDLEQDGDHLVVTEKEKAAWDAAAQRLSFTGRYEEIQNLPELHSVALTGSYGSLSVKLPIPTDLSDFESNEYYSLITLSEWESWQRKSEFRGSYHDLLDTPRIATKIADLKSDYEHLTVSNNDRNHWDNMAAMMDSSGWFKGSYNDLKDKPKIPTELRDLEQDTSAMTVSATYTPAGERQLWDDMADTRNAASIFTSEYEADALHATVTYADTAKWNTACRRIILDSLRHLDLDDGYQWATDSLKALWNRMTATYTVPDDTIDNLRQLTATVNQSAVSWFAGAETLKTTGDSYTNLIGSLASVAYSGDYNDLANSPSQFALMDSVNLTQLDGLAEVATSGNYDDLEDLPEITDGVLTGSFIRELQITGRRAGFTLADAPEFNGTTTVQNGIVVGDIEYDYGDLDLSLPIIFNVANNISIENPVSAPVANSDIIQNYASTIGNDKVINDSWYNNFKEYVNNTITLNDGVVFMWLGDASKSLPDCWKICSDFSGRFPVGVNNPASGGNSELSTYNVGLTGGKETHQLTIKEMPAHEHDVKVDKVGRVGDATSNQKTLDINKGDGAIITSASTGGNVPHNNIPPYRAIYFIEYSREYCSNR